MSPELPIALLAGVVLGASAHRAGLCTVKAVAEVITNRSAHFLWSFMKASLWTAGFLSVASSLGADVSLGQRPAMVMGIAGGLLFGLGAGLNGACSFSTLSRLAEGHLSMLITLLGWAMATSGLQRLWPELHRPAGQTDLSGAVAIPLVLWMAWEAGAIWRRRAGVLEGLKAGHFALAPAVLVIALANSVLLLAHMPWSFTSTALCSASPLPMAACAQPGLLWVISGAALLTMVGSALWRRSFRIRPPRWRSVLRHFTGGMAMGAGAALIPGGNDGLVLFGLPSLSPHAFPSWVAIVLGVTASLLGMRWAGLRIPRISCQGDVCRSAV